VGKRHFLPVVQGMHDVVLAGTARIAQIPGIDVCGKTGTAENPHGADHSVFIAFAPRDNPKIAIAVFVENGRYGSTHAAPIASLMIEQYLNGEIDEKRKYLEERMFNSNLLLKGLKQ
jgi:penicillin-binding protein 2